MPPADRQQVADERAARDGHVDPGHDDHAGQRDHQARDHAAGDRLAADPRDDHDPRNLKADERGRRGDRRVVEGGHPRREVTGEADAREQAAVAVCARQAEKLGPTARQRHRGHRQGAQAGTPHRHRQSGNGGRRGHHRAGRRDPDQADREERGILGTSRLPARGHADILAAGVPRFVGWVETRETISRRASSRRSSTIGRSVRSQPTSRRPAADAEPTLPLDDAAPPADAVADASPDGPQPVLTPDPTRADDSGVAPGRLRRARRGRARAPCRRARRDGPRGGRRGDEEVRHCLDRGCCGRRDIAGGVVRLARRSRRMS